MYTSQRCALRDLFKNYCSYRMIVSCVICKRSLWRNCGVRLLFYYCWFIFIGNKIEKRHKNYSSYEIWWKNFSVLHSDDKQSIFRLEQYYICCFFYLLWNVFCHQANYIFHLPVQRQWQKKYTILNWHCFLFIRFRVLRMCSITESWQMRLATIIMGAIKMDVFASKCYFAYSKLTKNVYDFAWPKSHFSPTEQTRAFLNEIQIS